MLKPLHTDKAPEAIGPYSQAIIAGSLVFCSGQIGINPKTGELKKDITEQTKQALTNLSAVLQKSGSSLQYVIKTTIFLTDMQDFQTVNEIYASFFQNHKPARSTIQVASLPKNALIEIDAIAEIPTGNILI